MTQHTDKVKEIAAQKVHDFLEKWNMTPSEKNVKEALFRLANSDLRGFGYTFDDFEIAQITGLVKRKKGIKQI